VHGVFDEFQSRFRKNHNTTMALLKVSNDLRESFNCGMVSLVLLLDFIEAFGRLLRTLGLSVGAISWIVSYFYDRAQCVSFGGKCSSCLDVNSGVLQDSILGSLLFSLYINDIGVNLKYCRHHLFADDCQIYYSFHPDDIVLR
jgi:hypothetical protein